MNNKLSIQDRFTLYNIKVCFIILQYSNILKFFFNNSLSQHYLANIYQNK